MKRYCLSNLDYIGQFSGGSDITDTIQMAGAACGLRTQISLPMNFGKQDPTNPMNIARMWHKVDNVHHDL